MSSNRGRALLLVIAVMLAIDGLWLWLGSASRPAHTGFQSATSGIGLTASLSPAWSFFSVDPRQEAYCENELWPIPGATCFNPHHGAGVADVPPLDAFSIGWHGTTAPITLNAD